MADDANLEANAPAAGMNRVREDAEDIKKLVKEKGKEELDGLKEPDKTQLYRSIFRVKHDDTPRARSLSVLSNVFLHLHPAKVNRDAVKYDYTWGHVGGITFYLFIVLTFTGVFADVLLPPDQGAGLPRHSLHLSKTTFRSASFLRNMHPLGPPT